MDKKTVFSGIQPSGVLTLGNYIGALGNFVEMQDEYNCFYCVVNLHTLTVRQIPAELRKNTIDTAILFMAAGIDPEKSTLFVQSDVSKHAELAWILNCFTYFGELNRMTQFKEKSQRFEDNINAGLFTYPSLMAADILLYQSDLVPVGDDQKQHLEISRDIAERMNNLYSGLFKVPEVYIAKVGARIMSLADPDKKMSKSDENQNSFISMLDDEKTIINKFKRAVTDSDNEIIYSDEKAGIRNLMNIYSSVTNKTIAEIENEFKNSGYGDFKFSVGATVYETLKPIQDKYYDLQKNKDYVHDVLKKNAEKADYLANKTLRKVYKKLGLNY